MSNAIAILRKDEIIERVAKGEFLRSIASSLGVTHPAISQQLANDPEYRAARQAGAELRLETQYGNLENSQDALTLARARETWKAAAWFAEREFPERWGQKQEITTHQAPPSINITVVSAPQKIVQETQAIDYIEQK